MKASRTISFQKALWVTGLFVILAPLTTYGLLILKGLPLFAATYPLEVLSWVYQATWLAALMSGGLMSAVVAAAVNRVSWFTRPYDFGRCFSLGAITGALAEAVSTWVYRTVSHRPFSSFWIGGAMIAGCITGAAITATVLSRNQGSTGE